MKKIIFLLLVYSLSFSGHLSMFSCIKICPEHEVLRLMQKESNITNLQDSYGDTLLHYAIRYRKYRIIHYLVDHGADVSKIGANGLTPVDIAVQMKDIDAVKFLMLSPTFQREIKKNSVQRFVLSHPETKEIAEDNFIDFLDFENDSFHEEFYRFIDKERRKSGWKRGKNFIKSQQKMYKSINKGNNRVNIE